MVDPWVTDRVALVAEQRGRVVAAALLLRYGSGRDVSDTYRDAGEIRWLLCWPEAPYWPDAAAAGDLLTSACLAQLARWQVSRTYADGALPAPGVYGVPEQWPHVRALLDRAGFVGGDRQEVVLVADVERCPPASRTTAGRCAAPWAPTAPGSRPGAGRPAPGTSRWRPTSTRAVRPAGWPAGPTSATSSLSADDPGLAPWLLARAHDWLVLAGVRRVLDYADADDLVRLDLMAGLGFVELSRTVRDLHLP